MEFIFLHKCIKDTATDETILTEQWLIICRRSWTPERTEEIPEELGRMKERRGGVQWGEKRIWDGTCIPEGIGRRENSPHLGKSPQMMGTSIGTEGEHLQLSEESETVCLWCTG